MPTADPTLRLTFTDLRLRVAEYLGIAYYGATGNEAAQLPQDPHDLDLVGRLVNDGYARFISDHEKGWKFLTVPFSITFQSNLSESDPARYLLPDDFYGIMLSPFTYEPSQSLISIVQVGESQIRELQAGSDTTGPPTSFALRAINTDATSTADRWEAIFWPTPSGTETVTALYKRYPQALDDEDDQSVAGFQHDRTVLAAALAEAELHRDDKIGPKDAAYANALKRSRAMDDRIILSKAGNYGDRSEDVYGPRKRYTMEYDNGQGVDEIVLP